MWYIIFKKQYKQNDYISIHYLRIILHSSFDISSLICELEKRAKPNMQDTAAGERSRAANQMVFKTRQYLHSSIVSQFFIS